MRLSGDSKALVAATLLISDGLLDLLEDERVPGTGSARAGTIRPRAVAERFFAKGKTLR